MDRPEALILGGGLAGAGLAILLAQQGRSVELLEKTIGPHDKVCGEFLSHEAVLYLERLGIRPTALGAVPIHAVRLAANDLIAEGPLPFPACSLTRRVLDEALLDRAAQAGVTVSRGCRVDALSPSPEGWSARLSDGRSRCASTVFLATGKHDLGGHPRPAGIQNNLVAFKMYFRLASAQSAALDGHVELILFPGGYAGLQHVEDGSANLSLVVTRSRLKQCGSRWEGLLEHMLRSSRHLAARLAGANPRLTRPLALSSIPYGLVHGSASDDLWRLGDQAAVIPSFSGDGMSIALHTAYLAAQLYLNGGSARSFQQRVASEVAPQLGLATTLSRLMVSAPALVRLLRFRPSLLGAIAGRTRVRQDALLTPPALAPAPAPSAGSPRR